jgi:hypothetical protein
LGTSQSSALGAALATVFAAALQVRGLDTVAVRSLLQRPLAERRLLLQTHSTQPAASPPLSAPPVPCTGTDAPRELATTATSCVVVVTLLCNSTWALSLRLRELLVRVSAVQVEPTADSDAGTTAALAGLERLWWGSNCSSGSVGGGASSGRASQLLARAVVNVEPLAMVLGAPPARLAGPPPAASSPPPVAAAGPAPAAGLTASSLAAIAACGCLLLCGSTALAVVLVRRRRRRLCAVGALSSTPARPRAAAALYEG